MDRIQKRETTVGGIMLACGLGYMGLTSQIPHVSNQYGFVDAAFVPYVLSGLMCLLGILQLLQARRAHADAETQADRPDHHTVLKTIGLIVAYVAILDSVGFLISTVAYLIIQFIVLTPAGKKPSIPLYGLIAVLTAAITYGLFRYGFDMILPVGLFGF